MICTRHSCELHPSSHASLSLSLRLVETCASSQGPYRCPTLLTQPPQPGNHLKETVELLAGCRSAEVELLQSLAGYRKLLMTWR